jgi:hypothetical protein
MTAELNAIQSREDGHQDVEGKERRLQRPLDRAVPLPRTDRDPGGRARIAVARPRTDTRCGIGYADSSPLDRPWQTHGHTEQFTARARSAKVPHGDV